MAFGLILEFDGLERAAYDATNRALGIDPTRATGPWPAGMLFHSAGAKPTGWVVFEVWASKDAQQRFLAERLGPALHACGVKAPPSRVEWLELATHTAPER